MMRLLLASAILPICQVVADWSFTSSTLLVARYDPIMAAGTFDTHAHCFFGANVIERTFDAAKVAKSACTSIEVQANKSLYWLPLLFYQKRDGTFDGVEGWAEIHYRQRNHNDEKIVAFPPGIKMIGGTPFRRVYNASNEGDRAVSYQCLDYSRGDSAPTTVFPTRGCPDGMISSVWLPSCWDGKRLESPDLSHIAYPVGAGAPEYGKCPPSHPVRFINILVQAYWETQWFDYRKDALTWAFGDKTGLGFHADFINGWDTKVLQAAIDTCKSGLDSCAPFKASRDDALADSCRPVMPITDEDFGMGESIPQMPGDNPVWTSGLTKPSYGRKIPDPQTFLPSSPLASGFVRSGCVSSNALNGASYEDEDDMSGERCTAYCARKGFKLAGTRDGTACHCGNSFTSSNAGASVAISKCNVRCSGQYYENCGGERNLSLYTKVSSARKRHMKADASARH